MSDDDINQRQADATGLVQSARAAGDGRPYLGDITAVEKLVRELAAGVLDRFGRVGAGEMTPNDAVQADQEACHQLARTLIGENPDYAPVPGWTDHGLADSIRQRLDEAVQSEDDVSVVAQAAAMFVHTLYGEIRNMPDDGGDEALQASAVEAVRSFVWLLVGLQSNE